METKNMEYAGFWKRFAAMVLDGVLIIFFASSLRWVLNDSLRMQMEMVDERMDYEKVQYISYMIWSVYLVFIRWCYFAGMESSPFQATLGKLALGLYVTDEHGERVSFSKATGRFFGKILSGLILGIGYIMAGTSAKKQALHDQMSGCLVLQE